MNIIMGEDFPTDGEAYTVEEQMSGYFTRLQRGQAVRSC